MKVEIFTNKNKDKVVSACQFHDAKNISEIAMFLAELELVKIELLKMFEDYNEGKKHLSNKVSKC